MEQPDEKGTDTLWLSHDYLTNPDHVMPSPSPVILRVAKNLGLAQGKLRKAHRTGVRCQGLYHGVRD